MADSAQASKSTQNVILYDAHCHFCAKIVRIILQHDKDKRFQFGAIQSPVSRALLRTHNINFASLNTVFLVTEKAVYTKSEAVFNIVKQLDGPIKHLSLFAHLPLAFTNAGYSVIAKFRYRIFGKSEGILPFPEKEKDRLIG